MQSTQRRGGSDPPLTHQLTREASHGKNITQLNKCNYQSYELTMDRTPAYRVQVQTPPPDQDTGMVWTIFQGCGQGRGGGGPGKGQGHLICYNCGGLGHYACECTNPMRLSCKYCTQFDPESEDCPTLIATIHDKGVLPPQLTQNL